MARDSSAARIAENESIFRDANERIQERARELEFAPPVPFLCECGEPRCRELVRLPLDEYERVRRDGSCFLVLPGHDEASKTAGRIVERHDTSVVVEKTGVAGDVAQRRDPRQTGRAG